MRKEDTLMIKHTWRYLRYALATRIVAGRGSGEN
jgi:hypothetical protein